MNKIINLTESNKDEIFSDWRYYIMAECESFKKEANELRLKIKKIKKGDLNLLEKVSELFVEIKAICSKIENNLPENRKTLGLLNRIEGVLFIVDNCNIINYYTEPSVTKNNESIYREIMIPLNREFKFFFNSLIDFDNEVNSILKS